MRAARFFSVIALCIAASTSARAQSEVGLEPFAPSPTQPQATMSAQTAVGILPIKMPRYRKFAILPEGLIPIGGFDGNRVTGFTVFSDLLTGFPIFQGLSYIITDDGKTFLEFDAGLDTVLTAAVGGNYFGVQITNEETSDGDAVVFQYGNVTSLGLPSNSTVEMASKRSDVSNWFWIAGTTPGSSEKDEDPGQMFRMTRTDAYYAPGQQVPAPMTEMRQLEKGQYPIDIANNGNVLVSHYFSDTGASQAEVWVRKTFRLVVLGPGDPRDVNDSGSLACGSLKMNRKNVPCLYRSQYNPKTNAMSVAVIPLSPNEGSANSVNDNGQIVGNMTIGVGRNSQQVPFFCDVSRSFFDDPRQKPVLVPFESLVAGLIRNRTTNQSVVFVGDLANNLRVFGGLLTRRAGQPSLFQMGVFIP